MELFVNISLKDITGNFKDKSNFKTPSSSNVVLYNLKTSLKETKMQSVVQADNLRLSLAVVIASRIWSRVPETRVWGSGKFQSRQVECFVNYFSSIFGHFGHFSMIFQGDVVLRNFEKSLKMTKYGVKFGMGLRGREIV